MSDNPIADQSNDQPATESNKDMQWFVVQAFSNYEKRVKRLAGLGLDDDAINRLIGPIGLDIGSRTSAEIAISIVAHLVKARNS